MGILSYITNYLPSSIASDHQDIWKINVWRSLKFFVKNNILYYEQHGFRSDRPVITPATAYMEAIINSME